MPYGNLKAGIISTGFIAPIHIEALKRLQIPVVAVSGSDKAVTLAEQWDIPNVFTGYDYKSLIAHPDVDVVSILSPNRLHHEMSMAALKAGKHCLCEKPLAMTTSETEEIVAAVAETQTVFGVSYNIRFYPAVLQMRELVQNGELGEIVHVNGSYMQDWLLLETDYNWRLLADVNGALRAAGDIGTHWIDLMSFAMGSHATSTLATLGRMHETRKRPLGEVETYSTASQDQEYESFQVDTEDYGNILLEFDNGARGNLAVSQVAAGRKNCVRVEIYGTKQSVWWDSQSPNELIVGARGEDNRIQVRGHDYKPAVLPYLDYPAGHNEGYPDTFKMMYRNFFNVAAGKADEPVLFATAKDGHREIAICEAILQSHQERRWVDIL